MLFTKIKWVLGVLLVFFLVLATNLMDRRNFRVIQNSIEVIYEKQLVSKNILLELSTLVHEKAMANALSDSSFYANRNEEANSRIEELFVEFEQTEMAVEEQNTLNLCKERFHNTTVLENERLSNPQFFAEGNRNKDLAIELEKISEDLGNLSLIQLEEGRQQMLIGEHAMSSIEMFTKMELIFLIVIAVLVQILILYIPSRDKSAE